MGIDPSREYPRTNMPPGIEHLDVIDFDVRQTICCYCKKQDAYGNVEHFINFLKKKLCI